ncbi:hypothetical protein ACLB1G_17185 [Oxalobacteraceae bacterium A2-2]
MSTTNTATKPAAEHFPDEHRPRSERIAARGVHLGNQKLKYVLPLVGLALLASVAFAAQG